MLESINLHTMKSNVNNFELYVYFIVWTSATLYSLLNLFRIQEGMIFTFEYLLKK